MRRLLVVLAALPLLASAAVPTITVNGKVLAPSGVAPSKGTITCTLSQSGSVLDGGTSQQIASQASGTIASDGTVTNLALVPNDAITPSGTYYTCRFWAVVPNGTAQSWSQTWQLASTPSPVNIGAVPRLNVIPGVALGVAVSGGDLTNGTVTATGSSTARSLAKRAVDVWYVDSVNGNDGNDGTGAGTALQTIAAVLAKGIGTNAVINLARGSLWREELTGLPAGVTVQAYGSGARPLLAADDVAANGSFTKTGGRTYVWQIPWTLSGFVSGKSIHSVWENGVKLTRVADVATCDATAGSFYAPAATAGPDTIYVHASDNSDVTANGKTYELAKRSSGVRVGDGTNFTYGGSIIGIHGRRNSGNDGSIRGYGPSYLKDCLAEDGTIHNLWNGGVAEDCIAWKHEAKGAGTGGGVGTLFITYTTLNSPGAVYRRCKAIGSAGGAFEAAGFYFHTSGGSYKHAKMTYEDCTAVNLFSGFGGVNATTMILSGSRTYRVLEAINATPTNLSVLGGVYNGWTKSTPVMLRFYNPAVTGVASLVVRGAAIIARQDDGSGLFHLSNFVTAVDVQRSTFAIIDTPGGQWASVIWGNPTTLTFSHNIVAQGPGGIIGKPLNVYGGPATTLTADWNVYYPSTLQMTWNGTTYGSIALYKTGVAPQEANTVTTDPQFLGNLSCGDVRTADASPAFTQTAGALAEPGDLDVALDATFYQQSSMP